MMFFRGFIPVLLVIGLLAMPAMVSAQEATPGAVVLPPDAELDGLNLAEWSARWSQWLLSLPYEVNPYVDQTGDRCGYGQSGNVFFLAYSPVSVERRCTLTTGVTVFVPIFISDCSTVEPPPMFGGNEKAMTACAARLVDNVMKQPELAAGMGISVDGQAAGDLTPYRISTPVFPLILPEENILNTSILVGSAVVNGYQVLLAPLSEGDHTVTVTTPFLSAIQNELVVTTYQLTVVTPRGT